MSLSENIKELYQEVILDHNKQPRNFGEIENCTNKASGFNQLCGGFVKEKPKGSGSLSKEI